MAAKLSDERPRRGDYYDFFPLPDDKWCIFVADVSGHGTPAAVVMAITHAIAEILTPGHPTPPGKMLAYLNERAARRYTGDGGTFVTALYAILDPAARTLVLSSSTAIRCRASFAAASPPAASILLPLGIDTNEPYTDHTLHLESGDRVLLFTDGIIEAFGPAGELYATAHARHSRRPACRKRHDTPS